MKTTTFNHLDNYSLEVAAMSIEDLPKWLAYYRAKHIPSMNDLQKVAIIEAELAARNERGAKLVEAK